MVYDIINQEFLQAKIDFSTGFPVLHLHLPYGCPLSLYKYIKNNLLENTLVFLGALGYDMVFSIIPEGDDKLLKFQKKMGFEEELREDGYVYLAQDIM